MTQQEFAKTMIMYKEDIYRVAVKEISFLMGQMIVQGPRDMEIICCTQKYYSVFFPIELDESICLNFIKDERGDHHWCLSYWTLKTKGFVKLATVSDTFSVGQAANILTSAFISFYEKTCLSKLKEENNNE